MKFFTYFQKPIALEFLSFGICLIFSLFVSLPLFHGGLFPTVDNIVVVRVDAMAQELANFQFPVRHSATLAHSHGYMLFNFYGPLPFYIAAILHLLGLNLVGAVKRTFFIAILIGTVSMYRFTRQFLNKKGAVISTILFIFSPFLGYDIYTRGGLGEVWALAFLPLVFWSFYMLIQKQEKRYIILSSISLSLVILSHNLTAYITVPFLFVWIVFFYNTKTIGRVLFSLLLSAGLSAFFWLPVFAEKSLVWVTFNQLPFSTFQNGFFNSLIDIIFPPHPQRINFIYSIFPLVSIFLFVKRKKIHNNVFFISIIFLIFSLFLTSSFSFWLWKFTYDYTYIVQFPWRLITIATVFSSFLIGVIVSSIDKKSLAFLLGGLIVVTALIVNYRDFRPTEYDYIDHYRAEDPCGTSFAEEYLPIWVKSCMTETSNYPSEIVSGEGIIQQQVTKAGFYKTIVQSNESILRFNEYYYPGWLTYIDGKQTPLSYENHFGMIEVFVPEGAHTVTAKFSETPLRRVADMLSVISFAVILSLSLFTYFSKRGIKRVNKK